MIEKEKIDEIVKKIADSVRPEKVVLFGSYANGNPTKHSDLDICVVVSNRTNKSITYDKTSDAIWGILVPTDIIVYRQKDFDEWENVYQAFPTTIMRTGKVLYEKRQN